VLVPLRLFFRGQLRAVGGARCVHVHSVDRFLRALLVTILVVILHLLNGHALHRRLLHTVVHLALRALEQPVQLFVRAVLLSRGAQIRERFVVGSLA